MSKLLTENKWHIAPRFLLRMTGFPLGLMSKLQFSTSANLIHQSFFTEGDEQKSLLNRAEVIFIEELFDKITDLQIMTAAPKFREALLLSNPANYALIERWIDGKTQQPSKFRQGLLTMVMYLQRFCMKNDTASFFGPFFWGSLNPESQDNVHFVYDAPPETRPTVFFSHWCVEMIIRWIEQFPETAQLIRPRPNPTVILRENRVYGFQPDVDGWLKIDQPVKLPDHSHDILALIDGHQFLPELFTQAHNRFGLTQAQTKQIIESLVSAGLIFAKLEIPVGLSQPMNYLETLLQQGHNRPAQAMVTRFQNWKQAFTAANLAERKTLFATIGNLFQEVTKTDATRGYGQHYAERTIFHEDATRNFSEFVIGGELLADFNKLGPVWDLLCLIIEQEYQFLQEIMVDRFRAWFPGQTTIPFVDYVSAFLDDSVELNDQFAIVNARVDALATDVFHQLVPPQDLGLRVVRRDMADIRAVVANFRSSPPPGAIINPDILIAAHGRKALARGDYKIVVGEVHASVDLLTHSPLAHFLSETDKSLLSDFVRERYRETARPDEWIADMIRTHKRKTSAFLSILDVEVEGWGRSRKAREKVVALADLEVHRHQSELRLYAPRWKRYIRLTNMRLPNGMPKITSPLRPFSLPEKEGGLALPANMPYCPRIQIDNVVLVRRAWQLNYQDWSHSIGTTQAGWDFNLFRHLLTMQHQKQLPRYIFAKIIGEPKPVFVDFNNYFLGHAFFKKWAKHHGSVIITEALPGLKDAWLEDEAGLHLCEMRTGWYRPRQN